MILNNEITVFNPQSGLKVAKGAMDKTGVGRIIPIKIEKPNSQPQPGDTGDGNTSSSGGGRFSGHKPQFQSGQGELKKWSGQDYEKIKRKCKSRGVLFEDPEFPAANHLLVDDNNQVKFFQLFAQLLELLLFNVLFSSAHLLKEGSQSITFLPLT